MNKRKQNLLLQTVLDKMEQKLWMWICGILVLVTIGNCASRHVQPNITKCMYYNQTLCESSRGTYGCGNVTQDCISADNDKPSYCYTVWTNTTNQLSIKLQVI
jgi:hypothetical protein